MDGLIFIKIEFCFVLSIGNVAAMKILYFLMVLHLTGLALFLKGFFPVKTAVPGYATWTNQSLEPNTREGSTIILNNANNNIYVHVDSNKKKNISTTYHLPIKVNI